MLVVGKEEVPHVSGFFIRYKQKVPAWERIVVAIVISINHEVFPYFIESLKGVVERDITGKLNISGKIVFKKPFVPL